MRTRIITLIAALLGATVTAGFFLLGGSTAQAKSVSVTIDEMAFSPSTITIEAGDTVTWTNADDVPHTVTGTAFDSGTIQPGGSYSRTFPTPGTFSYHCALHTSMTGSVIVQFPPLSEVDPSTVPQDPTAVPGTGK